MQDSEQHDGPRWADIRRDFEAGIDKSADDLCARYGISRNTLYAKVRRENWKRRMPRRGPKKAADPLARLKGMARRKIELLESG
jgi:hypothetical protein